MVRGRRGLTQGKISAPLDTDGDVVQAAEEKLGERKRMKSTHYRRRELGDRGEVGARSEVRTMLTRRGRVKPCNLTGGHHMSDVIFGFSSSPVKLPMKPCLTAHTIKYINPSTQSLIFFVYYYSLPLKILVRQMDICKRILGLDTPIFTHFGKRL